MFRKFLVMAVLLIGLGLAAGLLSVQAAPAHSDFLQPTSQTGQQPSRPESFPVFEANLSGANENPAVSTSARGRAVIVLDEDLSHLHYRLMVDELSNITAAHIHLGAPGVNGPIVLPLYNGGGSFGPGNPVSGTLTLNNTQLADLIAGNYYVNVHTTANPGGEIRGQLSAFTPASNFNAVMSGLNEVPPVDTAASGVANFSLNFERDTLTYEARVSDIISITASHIHTGWPGENGPIKFPLYTGTGAFDVDHPISGTIPLTGTNLLDLLTGYFYINVHTQANPAGEIRGQIGSGFHVFEAYLSGVNEVPPVATNASGRAVMVLDTDMSTLYYRVMVSDIISVTASHIHEGAPGQNGPIIFPLFTGSGNFDESHPISGTLNLTSAQVDTLIAGDYYVNVHTTANPNGEIRGQLHRITPESSFHSNLSGANEVPPVNTQASGTAHYTLSSSLDMLHYELMVSDIISPTAAHIHRGWPGENGPIVFTLYNGSGPLDENNPARGDVSLTAQDLLDLLTGYFYTNVQTQANPNGEIRGQIVPPIKYYFPFVANQGTTEQ